MKLKFYLLLVLHFSFCVFPKVNAQSPNWLWLKSFGGTGFDMCYSISTDALNNVYTTGYFSGTVDFDPGIGTFYISSPSSAQFISKLDASGNFIWAKTIGNISGGSASGSSIYQHDSGNFFTTGSFTGTVDFDPDTGTYILSATGSTSNLFISKFDSAFNLKWVKKIEVKSQADIKTFVMDSLQNIFIAGNFKDTLDINPDTTQAYNLVSNGNFDIYIAKLDSSAKLIWARSVGSPNVDNVESMALDNSSNVYYTGNFFPPIDFDPGIDTFNFNGSGNRIFISKLDSAGNFKWANQIISGSGGKSIAVNSFGNILITGEFNGLSGVDFDPGVGIFNLIPNPSSIYSTFVLNLDSLGNFNWAKSISGDNNTLPKKIFIDHFDNIYLTGQFNFNTDFDPGIDTFNLESDLGGWTDIFLCKLDLYGNFVWAKSMGGGRDEFGKSIEIDNLENLYLIGNYYSTYITFDSISCLNSGSYDMFISKLDTTILTEVNIRGNFEKLISIYPNPATNRLIISSTGNQKINEVKIIDITGRLISAFVINEKQQIELNTSNFLEGVYLIEIISNQYIITKRIIIQK